MTEKQKLLEEILENKKSIKIIIDALKYYEYYQRYETQHLRDSIKWNRYKDVSAINKQADDLDKYCKQIEFITDEFEEYLRMKVVKFVKH
tara:strand:- start:38 stop:307 length:270 start_codon:yes stop_codon:yes gene_type:complete